METAQSPLAQNHGMGKGIFVAYGGDFELSERSIRPPAFEFSPALVEETRPLLPVHRQALGNYIVHCQDIVMVSGSVGNPEKVLLVNRAEEPLKGALWPLGGRAVNCSSADSALAPLWRAHPLEASLFLGIYRESGLQPADIVECRKLGDFRIVFQDMPDSYLFNRDHVAELHAAYVAPGVAEKMDFTGARIRGEQWYNAEELAALDRQGKLLPHVKAATDAILNNRWNSGVLNLSDYEI